MNETEPKTPTREEILTRAVRTYGKEAQMKMMIEEMSELTKALCKIWRTDPGSPEEAKAAQSILEEAADVQIMIDQIRIMFGSTEQIEAKKVDRLRFRLDEYDFVMAVREQNIRKAAKEVGCER